MNLLEELNADMPTAKMTERERFNLIKESEMEYIPSNFFFLKATNGLRPKRLSCLLSSSGAGKSTLVRSIAVEAAKTGIVYNWLSEESVDEFKLGVSRTHISDNILDNLKIFSEQDHDISMKVDPIAFIDKLEERLRLLNPILIICDNLTTSAIYLDRFEHQPAITKRLKKMAKRLECALLVVLHTGKEISDNYKGLICKEDVRGKKMIANEAEYFYIMQEFKMGNERYVTIRLDKHRQSPGVENKLFLLQYSKEKNLYVGDTIIDFERFKEIFNSRNKL